MATLRVKGIAFDMYGTVVDAGAVAEACREVAADAAAFNAQWRAKQLEYTFLRSLMGWPCPDTLGSAGNSGVGFPRRRRAGRAPVVSAINVCEH